jgi:uracil-DNA glycosylase
MTTTQHQQQFSSSSSFYSLSSSSSSSSSHAFSSTYAPEKWIQSDYWKNYLRDSPHWLSFMLQYIQTSQSFPRLCRFLRQELDDGYSICPKRQDDVFRAFQLTPLDTIKVVIVGQDPYPDPQHAMGLAFSTPSCEIPESLKNIFHVAYSNNTTNANVSHNKIESGDLSSWARQGVFLWNTKLTCRTGNPRAHARRGWESFTERVLSYIAKYREKVVFMFWGRDAQSYLDVIHPHTAQQKHCIFTSTHPSPKSAPYGFLRCNHFQRANKWLTRQRITPIDWRSPEKTQRLALWIRDRYRFRHLSSYQDRSALKFFSTSSYSHCTKKRPRSYQYQCENNQNIGQEQQDEIEWLAVQQAEQESYASKHQKVREYKDSSQHPTDTTNEKIVV